MPLMKTPSEIVAKGERQVGNSNNNDNDSDFNFCQEYCRFEILLDVKRFLANKNMFARKMKIRQSRGKESREETKVSA